ncbi:flavodoxin family protein [Alkanindiges illinoisensis]|uniref:flavodoxin family protein n=1 Tax=Alkanindiges illinoisensis TaxID=197183 RepID=UPI0004798E72|nr:flavodoxin family protein [Alkanindiges illinoisensis]
MKKIAIVYHSAHGHTEHIARCIRESIQKIDNIEVSLLNAVELYDQPEQLVEFDGIIWGSPTYLGGVSGSFKNFMDSTGKIWRMQQFKGKLAAAFTVSSLPAGDKQSTLLSLFVFSMQHGMIWLGNPILPEQHNGVPYEEAANRLGSWSGLMAQTEHNSSAESFAMGDIKTAQIFGQNFAQTLQQFNI